MNARYLRRLGPLGRVAAGAAIVALGTGAGCASAPPAEPPTAPPPPPHPLEAPVEAIAAGEYAAAAPELFRISEDSCEAREIRYRALLLAASTDLDPRNPSAEIDRAAAAIVRLLSEEPPDPWTIPVVETLYLLALHLGAPVPDPLPAATDGNGAPIAAAPTAAAPGQAVADTSRVNGESGGEAADPQVESEDGPPPGAAASAVTNEDPETRRRGLLAAVRSVLSPEEPQMEAPAPPCDPLERITFDVELPELPVPPLALRIARLELERDRLTQREEELDSEITRLKEELERIRRTLVP